MTSENNFALYRNINYPRLFSARRLLLFVAVRALHPRSVLIDLTTFSERYHNILIIRH